MKTLLISGRIPARTRALDSWNRDQIAAMRAEGIVPTPDNVIQFAAAYAARHGRPRTNAEPLGAA